MQLVEALTRVSLRGRVVGESKVARSTIADLAWAGQHEQAIAAASAALKRKSSPSTSA